MARSAGRERGRSGRRRFALATALISVATYAVLVEPFPKGRVLLSLTAAHGIHSSDLPAIAMYLIAIYLIASWFYAPPR
jgi:hypothetical protein